MLKKSKSKIIKHMNIMNEKDLIFKEKRESYLELTFLDDFLIYFYKTFKDLYYLMETEENFNLNYSLLFYDKVKNKKVSINNLRGDVLILYSLVEEYDCCQKNLQNYAEKIIMYDRLLSPKLRISGDTYPENLVEPRLTRFRQKISTEDNLNIVAKLSSLNLIGLNFDKLNKKNKHYEHGVDFLDRNSYIFKRAPLKNALLNKNLFKFNEQGELIEPKFEYQSGSKIICLNNDNLLKLFDYNRIFDNEFYINLNYFYRHVIQKILNPLKLNRIFFIVRDEFVIEEENILNEQNNIQDGDTDNLTKVLPFSNRITGFNTIILGNTKYEINFLSISEFSTFLGGICFENAFLFKEGRKDQKFQNDLNQFKLKQYKLKIEETKKLEAEKEYYEDLERNIYPPKKRWKIHNKLTEEAKLSKLLEPINFKKINKNIDIEEKAINLKQYKDN